MKNIEPKEKKQLYNDGIGFIENWDFSTANMNEESRIKAVTTVASVCFNSPKAIGSVNLYNQLACESVGLPTSSYEFVSVLICHSDFQEIWEIVSNSLRTEAFTLDMEKYGEWIDYKGEKYLLTNLRACLHDENKYQNFQSVIDFKIYFNTSPEEIKIIKDNTFVFNMKIPLFTARQEVRHRAQSLQELSRRYTNDKTSKIEFYGTNKMMRYHNNNCLELYKDLISEGMKPEDARAVLPQATYTQLWSLFHKDSFDNFIKLRTKDSAQSEIRELANNMKELTGVER